MKKIVTLLALVLVTSGIFAQGNLTVTTGNTLTIEETSSITASGDLTNNGTVTLNSTEDDFSSLIVDGTAIGNIVYNRYVNSYDTNDLGGGWEQQSSKTSLKKRRSLIVNLGPWWTSQGGRHRAEPGKLSR